MKVGERLTFEGVEYEAVPSASGSCEGCAGNVDRRIGSPLCCAVGECWGLQVIPNDIKNISPDHLTREN